jgi:hypothetical protein
MKKIYIALFLLLTLLGVQDACSQKTSSKKTSSKKSKGSTEMGSSATKNWGVGLRVGDPLGLTIKKYFGDKFAVEFNLGKTFFWGSGYDGYYRYNDGKYGGPYPYYTNGNPYYGNPVPGNPYYNNGYYFYDPRAVSMQLHLLSQKSIPSVKGLQLYFGAGPQLRVLTYRYGYYYNTNQGPLFYSDVYRQVGIGLDGIFGTEYTFSGVPLTVFADINLYAEIAPVPLWLGIQGGIGARFNF